jgi:hypothetical protein
MLRRSRSTTGLHAIESDMTRRALRRSATWFCVGLAIAPVVDVADDAGLLTAPTSLDARGLVVVLFEIGMLVAIAGAAGVLLARHRPSDRTWFFVACVAVLSGYLAHAGLRASGIAALVALALAFVQLRMVQKIGRVEPERRSRPGA